MLSTKFHNEDVLHTATLHASGSEPTYLFYGKSSPTGQAKPVKHIAKQNNKTDFHWLWFSVQRAKFQCCLVRSKLLALQSLPVSQKSLGLFLLAFSSRPIFSYNVGLFASTLNWMLRLAPFPLALPPLKLNKWRVTTQKVYWGREEAID